MTETISRILIRAGERHSKVVRVNLPPDRGREHRLHIRVESGGALELQELYQAGTGEDAIRIESGGAHELQRYGEGSPPPGGLVRVEVSLAAGAKMRHVAMVDCSDTSEFEFSRRVEFALAEGAELDYTRVGAGAADDHEDLFVSMDGARSCFRHAALMLAERGRKASLDLRMTHRGHHAVSESLCRCILGAGGSGRFAGRITIAADGQGADARMRNENLLLDETARMETLPELEVHADEVQCAHGAATGALDEAALFYLKTRGLSPQQARTMLVGAFAARITNTIDLADAKTMATGILDRALDNAGPHKLAA